MIASLQSRARCVALIVLAGAALPQIARAAVDSYEREILAWRAERVTQLTAPDNWLTLIGLHFLHAGSNTVGSARDNDVVLARGPAHVGTVTVAADGNVRLDVAPNAGVRVDGAEVKSAVLRWSEIAKPTLVTAGTVTFFAIDRSGKKALRVRDSEAERRKHFVGLDYFPIDPQWRIEARWIAFPQSRIVPIVTMLGQIEPTPIPGKAVFERDGKTFELLPIDEGPDKPLFFVFSDATNGKESYGASRFLYVPRPAGESIVLDFNRAENPPCAFTPFATCPLPPKENRLPFAVRAGEQNYRGQH